MHPMSRVTSWRGTQKCALRIFRSSAYASSWCQDVAAPLIDLENWPRAVLLAAEVVSAPGAHEDVEAPVQSGQQA